MRKYSICLIGLCVILFGLSFVSSEVPQSKYWPESIHTTESNISKSFGKYHASIQFMIPDQEIENAIDYDSGDVYYLDPNESNNELTRWYNVVWPWENDASLQKQRIEFEEKLARNDAIAIYDENRGRLLSLTIKGRLGISSGKTLFEPAHSNFFPADDEFLKQIVSLFPELRQLRIIDMDLCMSNEGIKHLSQLNYLNSLEISTISRHYCNITNAGIISIGQCQNLKFLRLSNMEITDHDVANLAPLVGLRYIAFQDLSLSPQCFLTIAKFPSIRTIHITVDETLGRNYGKNTLDAIASLDGRLKYLYFNEGLLDPIGGTPINYYPDFFHAISQIKSLKSLSFGRYSHNDRSDFFYNYDEQKDSVRTDIHKEVYTTPITYEILICDLKKVYSNIKSLSGREWSEYENYLSDEE